MTIFCHKIINVKNFLGIVVFWGAALTLDLSYRVTFYYIAFPRKGLWVAFEFLVTLGVSMRVTLSAAVVP